MKQEKLHEWGNTIGLGILCTVLILAFADQFRAHDLPCPLCLLQRVCFVAVGLCLCMNLKEGIKTSNYGLMMLASILGLTIALRQISLHTAPGNPGYGDMLFGFYMYIWSAIIFITTLICIGLALLFKKGFNKKNHKLGHKNFALIILFLVLILANGISTFMECGMSVCPDSPVSYKLLSTTQNLD
jgi:disulfide bond formation protein DsbB